LKPIEEKEGMLTLQDIERYLASIDPALLEDPIK
jgi:hypothetical protein